MWVLVCQQSARNSFARNWSSVRQDRHGGATPDAHNATQSNTLSHLQEESHPDNASSHGKLLYTYEEIWTKQYYVLFIWSTVLYCNLKLLLLLLIL